MPKDFRKDVGRISQKDLVEKYSCQGTGDSTGLNRSRSRQVFTSNQSIPDSWQAVSKYFLAEDFM